MVLNLSWPAVSHICSLTRSPFTSIVLILKSTPIVVIYVPVETRRDWRKGDLIKLEKSEKSREGKLLKTGSISWCLEIYHIPPILLYSFRTYFQNRREQKALIFFKNKMICSASLKCSIIMQEQLKVLEQRIWYHFAWYCCFFSDHLHTHSLMFFCRIC